MGDWGYGKPIWTWHFTCQLPLEQDYEPNSPNTGFKIRLNMEPHALGDITVSHTRFFFFFFFFLPLLLFFLAHLSRRLTGELIGYPWIRRPSVVVVRPSTFSNIFSSKTAWPIKAKFYVEPPWEGGTEVYINGPGHMTKMAAMPIYGKNPSKIFFSRTGGPIFTKLGM